MGGDLGDMGEDGMGEGGREGMEREDGGGDTGKGVGGMVVSITFDTQSWLVVMALKLWSLQGRSECHLHP